MERATGWRVSSWSSYTRWRRSSSLSCHRLRLAGDLTPPAHLKVTGARGAGCFSLRMRAAAGAFGSSSWTKSASCSWHAPGVGPVSYTHLRAHETRHDLVCRLLLEKKKQQ